MGPWTGGRCWVEKASWGAASVSGRVARESRLRVWRGAGHPDTAGPHSTLKQWGIRRGLRRGLIRSVFQTEGSVWLQGDVCSGEEQEWVQVPVRRPLLPSFRNTGVPQMIQASGVASPDLINVYFP